MHILEEMDFLMENCSTVELPKLAGDKILSRACLKSLEIVGEASRNISEDLKKKYPPNTMEANDRHEKQAGPPLFWR